MSGTRFAWLFGFLVVLAGFVPVAAFALGSLLPGAEASAMLAYFPDVPGLDVAESFLRSRMVKWTPSAGLVFALLGVGVMFVGAAIARSQRPVLDAMQAHKRDARRRRQQYGAGQRMEPTLGPVD